ncbi:hypothetical protein ACFOLF_11970 [Paenibacillus sepulcri]|uniref:Uncharacterized protein n=1 Tax=Paenibacillus sepulcri TaxID=359917 RepID=A0ABS7C193_9BACL|nr:hypothetical protein [Paenibacillus sepulcri]
MAFNEKTDWQYNDLVTETDMNRIEQGIGDVHDRVDQIFEDSSVTVPLKYGTQIVEGGNVPAIAFPQIQGRTLVNMIGDAGNGESLNSWSASPAVLTLDSMQKVSGSSSYKLTYNGSADGNNLAAVKFTAPIKDTGRYLIIGQIKPNVGTALIYPVTYNGPTVTGDYNALVPLITDTAAFNLSIFKFSPNPGSTSLAIRLLVSANGNANFDDIRVYEISQTEYDELASMTPVQISTKYPCLGTGIHGVKNPTLTNIRDNLIPPFSEWTLHTNARVTEPYELQLNAITNWSDSVVNIPVLENQVYSFSHASEDDNFFISALDANMQRIGEWANDDGAPEKNGSTFITPSGTKYLHVIATNALTTTGTFLFKFPRLEIGAATTLFKPQCKTTVQLYTELLGLTGGETDSIEYMDGKLKKFKRYEKILLDGSLPWVLHQQNALAYKQVRIDAMLSNIVDGTKLITKYNGKILGKYNNVLDSPDQVYDGVLTNSQNLYISVSGVDSGWGDSYVPTVAEIQAYFYGWKMHDFITNPDGSGMFNGGSNKAWVRRIDGSNAVYVDSSNVLPTRQASNFKPYELQYQLAASVIEDVSMCGAVMLERGNNHITLVSEGASLNTASLKFADTLYTTVKDLGKLQILTMEKIPTMSYKNWLINGNFDIWQRRTSAINPTFASFSADRWKLFTAISTSVLPTSITHSRQSIVNDEIPNAAYFYRVNTNGAGSNYAADDAYLLQQLIENGTRYLAGLGKKVTVSFWARSSIAGKKLGIFLGQSYGTGGSPSAGESISGTTFSLTSTWTHYKYTFTTNTLKGKTFGTNGDDTLQVHFLYAWGNKGYASALGVPGRVETFGGSGNIDIAQVQVNSGDTALSFQPHSFAEELALCQRYFEKTYNYTVSPGTVTADGMVSIYSQGGYIVADGGSFKVEKRMPPTMTVYSMSGAVSKASLFTTGSDVAVSGMEFRSTSHAGRLFTAASGAQEGVYQWHWTADAEL